MRRRGRRSDGGSRKGRERKKRERASERASGQEAVLFLVTGNLKICLRVVEPPEETLLLAPRARRDGERGGDSDVVDVDDDDGDDGGSTNYTANGDIAFINSFAAATRRAKEKILSTAQAHWRARFGQELRDRLTRRW